MIDINKDLVWGFYEEERPIYMQGQFPTELHSLITAEEANQLVEVTRTQAHTIAVLEGATRRQIKRIEELLEANNVELERRRAAEAALAEYSRGWL